MADENSQLSLENELLACKDQADLQLRDQIENVLQPVICQAYFLALESLSRRYLLPLIIICSEITNTQSTYFLSTYKHFLEGDAQFEDLPIVHKAVTISNMLDYDIGIEVIERHYNETLRYLLSPVKRIQSIRRDLDGQSSGGMDLDNQEWPYNRSNDDVLGDVQYVLKALLAVSTRGGSEENAHIAAAVQQDGELVHSLIQTILDLFDSAEKYNIDCLQVAGMVLIASINLLGDAAFALELMTGWFIEGTKDPSRPASVYAAKFDINIPDKLTSNYGWNSPESPMLMIIRGMISNTSLKSSLLPIFLDSHPRFELPR